MQPQRLPEPANELGYMGGKSIFDDYVRELRPRFLVRRTFQRTVDWESWRSVTCGSPGSRRRSGTGRPAGVMS